MDKPLTAFWIAPQSPHDLLGYGVTAFSLSDAFSIIQSFGYQLPDDLSLLHITEDICVAALDDSHVVHNMGPIVVRGLWYPFVRLGL